MRAIKAKSLRRSVYQGQKPKTEYRCSLDRRGQEIGRRMIRRDAGGNISTFIVTHTIEATGLRRIYRDFKRHYRKGRII